STCASAELKSSREILVLSSRSHSDDQLVATPSSTTAREAAIGPKVQVSSAIDRLFKAWHFCALILLICGGVGVLSVARGPVNYWDRRYYELYALWAYLHARYLYDVGPA